MGMIICLCIWTSKNERNNSLFLIQRLFSVKIVLFVSMLFNFNKYANLLQEQRKGFRELGPLSKYALDIMVVCL